MSTALADGGPWKTSKEWKSESLLPPQNASSGHSFHNGEPSLMATRAPQTFLCQTKDSLKRWGGARRGLVAPLLRISLPVGVLPISVLSIQLPTHTLEMSVLTLQIRPHQSCSIPSHLARFFITALPSATRPSELRKASVAPATATKTPGQQTCARKAPSQNILAPCDPKKHIEGRSSFPLDLQLQQIKRPPLHFLSGAGVRYQRIIPKRFGRA